MVCSIDIWKLYFVRSRVKVHNQQMDRVFDCLVYLPKFQFIRTAMGHYCFTNIYCTYSLLSVINIYSIITRRIYPSGIILCSCFSIELIRKWIRHDCIWNAIFKWITWHLVNNIDISCHNNHFWVLFVVWKPAAGTTTTASLTTTTVMASIAMAWQIRWDNKII